jgi:hypothetical protein
VDSYTPEEEKFDVGIDILFTEILVFVVGVYELFSSLPAREDEIRARGERKSAVMISLQRKGAGKKLLRALRLMMPVASSGVGRADRSSTVRPALMSSMAGMISWMESSAAPRLTMTGMDIGPVPTRHPTLFVLGRRRVPPKLWGLWRTVIPLCCLPQV